MATIFRFLNQSFWIRLKTSSEILTFALASPKETEAATAKPGEGREGERAGFELVQD